MKQNKRSSLFLIELMAAILFFSLSAAVCMQFFAKSRLLSNNSSQLHHSLLQAQSAAESLEAGNGTFLALEKAYPTADISENHVSIYFDRQWDTCSPENSFYELQIKTSGDGLILADISVSRTGNTSPIYELHTEYYSPLEVNGYE